MTRIHVAVLLLSVAACNRYEYQTPDCPPEPPPRLQPTTAPAPQSPGSIVGLVVRDDGSGPVSQATVVVESLGRRVDTDSLGMFRLDGLAPGWLRLSARRIGYERGRLDSVRVSAEAGARVQLTMKASVLDGCPGFAVRVVQKPWWKWW